jgi:hypothetical protein
VFAAIYIIIAAFFLSAPVFFINYELIFESGLVGWTVGIAFLLTSVTIIGNEYCLTRGEFIILTRHVIMINFASFASIVYLCLWYIWNIIDRLLKCAEMDVNMTDPFGRGHGIGGAGERRPIETRKPSPSLSEDEYFHSLRDAKICRNEQGFGVFLLVLLIIVVIINFVTIIVYSWLWRKIRCLPPVCVT